MTFNSKKILMDELNEDLYKITYINSKIDLKSFYKNEKYNFSKIYKFIDDNFYSVKEYDFNIVRNNYIVLSFIGDKLVSLFSKSLLEESDNLYSDEISDELTTEFESLLFELKQHHGEELMQDFENVLCHIQNKIQSLLDLCIEYDSKDYDIIN